MEILHRGEKKKEKPKKTTIKTKPEERKKKVE